MASTKPVIFTSSILHLFLQDLERLSLWTIIWTDSFGIINLAPFVGNDILIPRFESVVLLNSQVQMESNTPQDSVALALQIQILIASVEELTRQNQKMRLRLQQKDNCFGMNWDDDKDSQRRDD